MSASIVRYWQRFIPVTRLDKGDIRGKPIKGVRGIKGTGVKEGDCKKAKE